MSKNSSTVKSPEVQKKRKPKTDWARVDAIRDEDIDYSDIPPITPEMFAKGVVKKGGVLVRRVKQPVTLRVKADVLEWFKARGKGYQTEMNAVLEAYVKAHNEAEGK
jgi:uncharacterized protein (DUF4415 family)